MTEPDLDIPRAWREAAGRMLHERWRRLLVIGQADVGKSSFCRYLSRQILDAGMLVALVDADVGQKDIGPPATVTLGYPEPPRDLSEVAPTAFHFVGSTNPIKHMTMVAEGAARLTGAARAPFAIVNTPGIVHGPGRALLRRLIGAVRPDAIAALEAGSELAPVAKACRHSCLLRLPRSPMARNKSGARRQAARRQKFAAYFAAATQIQLAPEALIFETPGRHERRCGAGLLNPASIHNLLCGVADGRGDGLGLAIVDGVEPSTGTLTLITPVPRARIEILQLGEMYLTPDGREWRGNT